MAILLSVQGPITVTWGGTAIGEGDGQQFISIEEVKPTAEVRTDSAGGEPSDWIQLRSYCLVQLPLIRWEDSVVDELLADIAATSAIGAPVFTAVGVAGPVGMLRMADGGYKQLVITPTKARSANGGHAYTFPRAFPDPQAARILSEIGAGVEAKRLFTLRCEQNDSGQYYTRAAVT